MDRYLERYTNTHRYTHPQASASIERSVNSVLVNFIQHHFSSINYWPSFVMSTPISPPSRRTSQGDYMYTEQPCTAISHTLPRSAHHGWLARCVMAPLWKFLYRIDCAEWPVLEGLLTDANWLAHASRALGHIPSYIHVDTNTYMYTTFMPVHINTYMYTYNTNIETRTWMSVSS